MAAKIINILDSKGRPKEDVRNDMVSSYKKANQGKIPRIVFVSGNFNIIHPGHQRLLQFAINIGDILVVGVNPDSSDGIVFPQAIRVSGVKELNFVNYVIPINDDQLLQVISALKPDVVVKGKEHERHENSELTVLSEHGGRLIFGSGDQKFSSIDLLRKDFENIQYSTIVQPASFLERHDLDRSRLLAAIENAKGLNVVVIGDTIVDEYITCEALGLSQEDPTIVVNPIHRIKFLGGAAIVAAHAAGLGANVHFMSVIGQDENAVFTTQHLNSYGVTQSLFEDQRRPTTLKQRYRAGGKTLLRVNELSQQSIPREIITDIINKLKAVLKNCDLLVFSDFNYGCLPTSLVNEIIDLAKKYNVVTVADSQSSSQIGDISRFKGMKLLTPTEREARLGVSDFESGLIVLSDSLIEKASAENVFITMGAEGLLIRARVKQGFRTELVTDKLPAFNSAPKDPAGAGDSLLIASSMILASGGNIWEAAFIGSLAAAIQVSRVGNTPLTTEELIVELKSGILHSGIAS